jgi:hypothetical protein
MAELPPLHEQLGCFGYYGFGTGYALAKFGVADDTRSVYCNRCPVRVACWQAHKERVRSILPAACALADEIAMTFRAPDYIQEWRRRTQQEDTEDGKLVEPYLGVMGGNTHDGGHVALTGRAHQRGDSTLTWPLKPIPQSEEDK